jgi:hypothetical protein
LVLLSWLARRPQLSGPLASRNFRLLAGCNVISRTGSAIAFVAIPFAVLRAGGSAADIGYVATAELLPLTAVLLLGGVVAGRLPRHQVMAAANALQALAPGHGRNLAPGRAGARLGARRPGRRRRHGVRPLLPGGPGPASADRPGQSAVTGQRPLRRCRAARSIARLARGGAAGSRRSRLLFLSMAAENDEAVAAAVAGELRLLDPAVRRAPEQLTDLLHPDFLEFGASGRRWSRPDIIEELAAEQNPGGQQAVAEVSDLTGTRLAADVVLVTYVSQRGSRRCRRSSVWRRTPAGWRVFFHQGTIIPPG